MKRILLLSFILSAFGGFLACGGAGGVNTSGDSPTEAYKRLYAAVKRKDTDAIKATMTKKTQEFVEMAAQRSNKKVEEVYENGLTATTFPPELPEIRDERVKDNAGAVEVWNARDRVWEDLPFINEDGVWKIAIGEMFAGTFASPGKGRDLREKEAANAAAAANATPFVNTNANFKIPEIKPNSLRAPANAANANK